MRLTAKRIADKVNEFTGLDIRSRNRNRGVHASRLIYVKLCIEVGEIHQDKICDEINRNRTMYYNYYKNIYNEFIFTEDIQYDYLELESILLGKKQETILEEKHETLKTKYNELLKNYKNSLNYNRVVKNELLNLQEENLNLKLKIK